MAVDPRQGEDVAVRHLVKLGYVDPDEAAARRAELRRRLEAELRSVIELVRGGGGAEAIDVLDRLAGEDPDWISPRQLLAEIHFRGGNWQVARQHLDWLAHHNVVTPRLAVMTASMALARRDLRGALADLEYARHVDSALAGVQTLLGTVQMRLGRWDAAEDAFGLALRQNPTDARALDGLSAVAVHRRDFDDAAHWALKALEHDIRLFRAHYHLGMALVHLDRTQAAAEAFMTCTRLDPLRAAPFRWLSRIANDQRGDSIRAAEYRDRGREIIRQRRSTRENSRPARPFG